jgi:hypothetical protein
MTTTEPLPDNTVSVNVKKHKVIVIDEMIVHIHHTKSCQKPCVLTKDIVGYLEAELFVKEGYLVSNV